MIKFKNLIHKISLWTRNNKFSYSVTKTFIYINNKNELAERPSGKTLNTF